MRRLTQKVIDDYGMEHRIPKNMRFLLNYNILDSLNRAKRVGEYDLPALHCNTDVMPEYIALYSQRSLYRHSLMTCVAFYEYDRTFDGPNGLFNAIYYNDKIQLAKFKERFKDVDFFVSPDYSVFGDINRAENLIRVWKARIVSLWLSLEMSAVVIPNIMYSSEDTFADYMTGLEDCSVVAFSTKGHIRNHEERRLTKAAVKYAVDNLPIKTILAYSVCGKDETALKLFKYATDRGIKIVIPDNSLRARNRVLANE